MGSAKYGLWTTYFLVAVFALAAVVNGLKRLEVLSRCVVRFHLVPLHALTRPCVHSAAQQRRPSVALRRPDPPAGLHPRARPAEAVALRSPARYQPRRARLHRLLVRRLLWHPPVLPPAQLWLVSPVRVSSSRSFFAAPS